MILSCVAHRSISFCILPIPPGYKTFTSDSAEDLAEEFELNKIDSVFFIRFVSPNAAYMFPNSLHGMWQVFDEPVFSVIIQSIT